MDWSSKSLGSRLQHQIFYLLVRCRLLGVARALLVCVVFYYTLLPSVRSRAVPYLSRRFPQDTGFARWRHCMRLYLCFAQGLLDRTIAGILGTQYIYAEPVTQQQFHNSIPQDTGCIILTAHIGAWQLGISCIEPLQRPINIVQWVHPEDKDKHYFQHNNELGKHNIRIINSRDDADTTLKIVTALRKKELLCITGDRITSAAENSVPVSFMGGTVHMPTTAFVLASLAQVPLVIAFTLRHNAAIKGFFVQKLDIPHNLRRDPAALRERVQYFATAMEQMVHDYPYHFFNFFDMWSHDDNQGMPRQA